jgi:hypothetical protein
MGTAFDSNLNPDEEGIIPRSIIYLFKKIEQIKTQSLNSGNFVPKFSITAQFMELYNEEINDLFSNIPINDTLQTSQIVYMNKSKIEIHEDQNGAINLSNITMREVRSANETLEMLKLGAKARTTGATNMNLTSSRSHAIFTLHIKQTRASLQSRNLNNSEYISLQHEGFDSQSESSNGFETLTAKFHFVDLAGSERLKRTGATGHRAKEGICINRGLLALGNVISALGDKDKRGCHVPYRDSKLTRLLQDSLGGNSRTLMIACISPSDRDFMETLNTLRYSNRARNIKNKVVVNQDKTSKQIAELKAEIEKLKYELMQYKTKPQSYHLKNYKSESSHSICTNKTTSTLTIVAAAAATTTAIGFEEDNLINEEDLKQENELLLKENHNMRMRIKAMQESIESLRNRNIDLEISNKNMIKKLKTGKSDEDDNFNYCISESEQNYIRQIEILK